MGTYEGSPHRPVGSMDTSSSASRRGSHPIDQRLMAQPFSRSQNARINSLADLPNVTASPIRYSGPVRG